LLLPMAFFIVFRYLPMANVMIAFKDYSVVRTVWQMNWSNPITRHFDHAFAMPAFHNAVRNTLVFSFLDLAIGFPAPIILALLLNELKFKRFKRVTQTISYMPHFLSWIIIAGMARQLFSPQGAVNVFLYNWFGMDAIPFLGRPAPWVATVVGIGVWRSIGWNTILYLAAITGVNPELYEAADADEASRLRKMWHVTLPGILPVIIILFILTLGQMLAADFDRFLALGNPLVRDVYQVLPVFIYQWGLQSLRFSLAAAVGLIQSGINLILLLGANYVVKKMGGQGLW